MEDPPLPTSFAALVAASLGDRTFTLIDVGCDGGLDAVWRAFAPRLTAFAFNANLAETERLTRAESVATVHYIPSHVAGAGQQSAPREAGSAAGRKSRRSWFGDGAGPQTPAPPRPPGDEPENATDWADPSFPLFLPNFLRGAGIEDIDVVDLDPGRNGMDVLASLGETLLRCRCVAVALGGRAAADVGRDGIDRAGVDRLMQTRGFAVFHRRGRSLYARDLSGPSPGAPDEALDGDKKAKLAAILSLFGLPDRAAGILNTFRSELASVIDVTRGLDLLTSELQAPPASL